MWQLVVAVLGFGLAIWQLARTANATEQSTKLLERRLLSNDLLLLLPEMHRLEDDFDAALKDGNPDLLSMTLVAYGRQASRIMGHMKSDDRLKDEKLIKLLKSSTSAAATAKGQIQSRSGTEPLNDVVGSVRVKMSAASGEISELTARLQRGVEG